MTEFEGKPLQAILTKYPTDKLLNGYGPIYEELFAPYRESATSICEIGIFKGGSLQAWEEYFPNAVIVGIDKEKEFASKTYGDRIFSMWINVSQPEQLTAAMRYYDIIIDDGSHKWQDIETAFVKLWPMVNPDGLYIIEDVDYGNWYGTIDEEPIGIEYLTRYPKLNLVVIKKCK